MNSDWIHPVLTERNTHITKQIKYEPAHYFSVSQSNYNNKIKIQIIIPDLCASWHWILMYDDDT